MNGRAFTIGGALGRTGVALGRTWLTFLLVSILIGLPELYVFAWIDEHFDRGGFESLFLASTGIALLDGIGSAWLTIAVLAALSGRTSDRYANWRDAVRLWLVLVPMIAVANFAWNSGFGQNDYLRFGVGIIAAIVIATALWVYVPVAAAERNGLWTSLRRSLSLVSGNGWRVGILVLLYLLAYVVVVTVAWNLAPFGLTTDFVVDYSGNMSIAGLLNILLNESTSVLSAVCYVLLRNDKDGVPVEDVAPVFD